jgi:hypothetical protein
MTIQRVAQAFGLGCIAVFGIVLIVASGGGTPPPSGPPAAPTLLSLELPNDAFGKGFAGTQPHIVATGTTPANYIVLPLLPTTAPIVRAVLDTPSNSSLTVRATDQDRATPTVTLPSSPASSPGPTTGYYQVLNAPSGWHVVIRYPNAFQGSKSIRTSITDTVGGVASAPVMFDMNYRGSIVSVAIVTPNNDGRVTSSPPGIDCPGVCSFDFGNSGGSNVLLNQSVLHNQTEFVGWTGSCMGPGPCSVSLQTPTPPVIPANPMVTANFRLHVNAASGVEEVTLSRSTDSADDQFVYVNPLPLFVPQGARVSNVTNVSTDVNGHGVKLELVRHANANNVSRSLPAATCPTAPLEPQASTSTFNGMTVEGEWKVRAVCVSQVFLNNPPTRIALQVVWTK